MNASFLISAERTLIYSHSVFVAKVHMRPSCNVFTSKSLFLEEFMGVDINVAGCSSRITFFHF